MFFFLFILSSLTSFAHWDASVGTQLRSLPMLGGEIYAEGGKSFVLWGKKTLETKDIKYGLIRPSLGGATSAIVNSFKAELEIFPISFIGLTLGRQYMHSNLDFPFFDCDELLCQGEYQRNYVEGKLALGFKGVILLTNYRVDTVTAWSGKRAIADWRHVIAGDRKRDIQREAKAMLGYTRAGGRWLYGVLGESVGFEGSGEYKEAFTLVTQYRPKEIAYLFGIGSLMTDRQAQGLVLYFRAHYQALPSLKLF